MQSHKVIGMKLVLMMRRGLAPRVALVMEMEMMELLLSQQFQFILEKVLMFWIKVNYQVQS